MSRKTKATLSCSAPAQTSRATCRVESIVSIDERGQMVLPKELRERAGIRGGDKLALSTWEKDGAVCCITLMRVEDLVGMVKGQLGPIIKEIL